VATISGMLCCLSRVKKKPPCKPDAIEEISLEVAEVEDQRLSRIHAPARSSRRSWRLPWVI
jgi:hypothetical protein